MDTPATPPDKSVPKADAAKRGGGAGGGKPAPLPPGSSPAASAILGPDSEWKEKVIQIRRVTKVVKGGKKMSFRSVVIVGNGDGMVDAADYTVWRDHLGDMAVLGAVADTTVRFGVDAAMGDEPLYNASTDKDKSLGGDDPDAVISIAAPSNSVPEPTTLWLMAWAVSATSIKRHKSLSN